MKPAVVDYVVCPVCRARMQLTTNGSSAAEVIEGTLRCRSRGRHAYCITRGIPVLLPAGRWSPQKRLTERSFSAKWHRASDYLQRTGGFYRQWYLQRYGFGDLEALRRFLRQKRFILDAGTGTGRDSQLYAEHSEAQVFGIDISEGIERAYRDLKQLRNLHLIRADLTRPPFSTSFFDFIACDQVLHHTPNPREALRQLVRCLRPGGHIAFYLYRKKGPIREFCDDYLRCFTTRMTESECYRFSEAVTRFGRALSKLKVAIEVPDDIPLLGLKAGRYDLQRFFHWNVFKCFWNDEFDFTSNVIVNFDWYHPMTAYCYTAEEIRRWCREMRLGIVHFDVIEAGISVLATKKA